MKAEAGLWLSILLLAIPSASGLADLPEIGPENITWSVEPAFSFPRHITQ
jgi:hypothetical protein